MQKINGVRYHQMLAQYLAPQVEQLERWALIGKFRGLRLDPEHLVQRERAAVLLLSGQAWLAEQTSKVFLPGTGVHRRHRQSMIPAVTTACVLRYHHDMAQLLKLSLSKTIGEVVFSVAYTTYIQRRKRKSKVADQCMI